VPKLIVIALKVVQLAIPQFASVKIVKIQSKINSWEMK